MKKLVGILAISALAVSAFAQGQIAVANTGTELVQQWANPSGTSYSSVAANGGMIQFFAAADGTAFNPLGAVGATGFTPAYTTLAGFLAANTGWGAYNTAAIAPIAGRFNAGTVTVSPLAAGGNIEYVVIGWTGASATLDAALATGSGAYIGESSLYKGIATGNPTTTPPGSPTLMNASFTGVILAPTSSIPEPSTFALAGLGAAAMLILRRRK